MGKITKAAEYLTEHEIEEKIKTTVGFWRIKRWMVIRHALVNPCTAKEIALNIGMAKQSVHNLIAAYNRYGEKAVETKGKAQRQRANLTITEEIEFLNPLFEKAEKGQVTTTGEIKERLEEKIGHSVAESTVYRLLHQSNKVFGCCKKSKILVKKVFPKTFTKTIIVDEYKKTWMEENCTKTNSSKIQRRGTGGFYTNPKKFSGIEKSQNPCW